MFAPILTLLYGKIPPVAGTFRCDDPSIRFEYQGDTVSAKLLFQAILLPIILVVGLLTNFISIKEGASLLQVFVTEAFILHSTGSQATYKEAVKMTAFVYFR